jgi:diguanylate cyclase (GGDEF)-like protein
MPFSDFFRKKDPSGSSREPSPVSSPNSEHLKNGVGRAAHTSTGGEVSNSGSVVQKVLQNLIFALGENGFDTEKWRQETLFKNTKMWVEHLSGTRSSPSKPGTDASKTDFEGLLSFVKRFRSEEVNYVKSTLQRLKQLVWDFLTQFSALIAQSQEDSVLFEEAAQNLKSALGSGQSDTIRSASIAALSAMEKILKGREARLQSSTQVLREEIKALRTELFELKTVSERDGLTQLFNRAALDEHLAQTAQYMRFVPSQSWIILCDIDHFKKINDSHGHQVGDVALVSLSNLLLEHFPSKVDFVARYGGEELIVVVSEETEVRIRERLVHFMKSVRDAEIKDGTVSIKLTVSVGVAKIVTTKSLPLCLKAADDAMYRAKEAGRDRVVFA